MHVCLLAAPLLKVPVPVPPPYGHVVAPPTERHPSQGELCDRGPLAHQREQAEDQRASRLPHHHDHDRLNEA